MSEIIDQLSDLNLALLMVGNDYSDVLLGAMSELTAANARIAALEALLGEAIESIEDWAGYASDYFQEKHGLSAELKKYRVALNKSRA